MSGVISFASNHEEPRTWLSSGWIFRGVLNQVIENNKYDQALVDRVQQAKYHNGLHFEILREENPKLAEEIFQSLSEVAKETVAGEHRLRINDRKATGNEEKVFQKAVAELLKMIDRERF